MKRLGAEHVRKLHEQHGWRKLGIIGAIGVCVVFIVVQLAYPWNALPLYAAVGEVDVGGASAQEATKTLDKAYAEQPIKLYFGESDKAYREPLPQDIGLTIDSQPQVQAQQYAWWQRLIPSSLLWIHLLADDSVAPTYQHDEKKAEDYVKKELGKSCDVKPQNATVTYRDEKLEVVPAIDGGTCKLADVTSLLTDVKPTLTSSFVRIPMDARPAKIDDKDAGKFVTELSARTATGMTIEVGDTTVSVDQKTVLSWLDFKAVDGKLIATVNTKKAAEFLSEKLAPKVTRAAGTSRVTTRDFTIVSQQIGATGQALDQAATLQAINDWLAGASEDLSAKVRPVAPRVAYTRHYSPTDTGLSALITQFAQEHPGQFGVSMIEITGKKRRATYQDTKQFRTASTYKLFVAYSALKRVDEGKWKWNMQVHGGRNLEKCLHDMIVVSDNPCGEELLQKITPIKVHEEIQRIGLSRSTFIGKYIMTTAGDLTTFVGALHAGQLLSKSSTDRLLGWMKGNIYRQGIPAGAKGTVADKVGFLPDPDDGIWYYNDAAIVYGPSGTYALSIMTKGSSWSTIAELTRKIEALRSQ